MRHDPYVVAIAGRQKRALGSGGTTPLQTRVPEHVKTRYDRAAARRGISLSLYLERLIDLDPLADEDHDVTQEDPLAP